MTAGTIMAVVMERCNILISYMSMNINYFKVFSKFAVSYINIKIVCIATQCSPAEEEVLGSMWD